MVCMHCIGQPPTQCRCHVVAVPRNINSGEPSGFGPKFRRFGDINRYCVAETSAMIRLARAAEEQGFCPVETSRSTTMLDLSGRASGAVRARTLEAVFEQPLGPSTRSGRSLGGAGPRRKEANMAATARGELDVRERLLTSGPPAPGGDLSRTAEPQCWHPGERLGYL